MGLSCSKTLVDNHRRRYSVTPTNNHDEIYLTDLYYQNLNQPLLKLIIDSYLDNKSGYHSVANYRNELIIIFAYFNNLDHEILTNLENRQTEINSQLMKLMIKNINYLELFGNIYLKKLPIIKYQGVDKHKNNRGAVRENECPICLNEFKKGDKLKKLPCGHLFHQTCISEWFQRKMICPNCKYSIIDKKISNLNL